MKVTYKIDERLTVEVEGDTQQDVFEQLARAEEVFGDNVCKAKMQGEVVTSNKVKFVVRESDDGKFFEKVCIDWDKKLNGYKKSFGCHKKGGGLFPKEMPENNRIPGLNGWHKYVKPEDNKKPEAVKEESPF